MVVPSPTQSPWAAHAPAWQAVQFSPVTATRPCINAFGPAARVRVLSLCPALRLQRVLLHRDWQARALRVCVPDHAMVATAAVTAR